MRHRHHAEESENRAQQRRILLDQRPHRQPLRCPADKRGRADDQRQRHEVRQSEFHHGDNADKRAEPRPLPQCEIENARRPQRHQEGERDQRVDAASLADAHHQLDEIVTRPAPRLNNRRRWPCRACCLR